MKRTVLEALWKEDCIINELALGESAARTPRLHAKYLGFLMQFKLQLRKVESENTRLRRNKRQWFFGTLSEEELKALGWTPYLKKDVLKSYVELHINEDEDVIRQTDKIEYLKNMVNAVDLIMKSIASRSYDIKSAISMHQYQGGV